MAGARGGRESARGVTGDRMAHSRMWRIVPTLGAVVGVILTAYLGSWQLERAAYKRAMQARIDQAERAPAVRIPPQPAGADDFSYRRAEATGRFIPEATILLDIRVRDGVVGYEVITPLQLNDSPLHVLVARGWVRAPASRTELPALHTPSGEVTVEGMALPPSTRYFELSDETVSGPVWQNLKFEQYAQRFGLALQPLILQQRNDLGDGLSRTWRRPDAGVDKHQAYALQWFVMSAVIAILYLVLHVRRKRKEI